MVIQTIRRLLVNVILSGRSILLALCQIKLSLGNDNDYDSAKRPTVTAIKLYRRDSC